ncbi:hypothetical protein [Pseudomonas cremoricolorata]|uniref:Lipoprotein n=1 Tax=Pseudomonas cremoricolorata TaxID=157783 RepID=A0A089WTU7_9PSED|nr:hypothetical protein [Pseudomonas cremoricolorata]AIR90609.1 hypothetical protein LK03_15580 [Pseudomonas cremoricolorata]
MRFNLSPIPALLAALVCIPALAADDVSGVKLGSTLAEATAAISNINDQYKVSPLKLQDGSEAGVSAVTDEQSQGTGFTDFRGPVDQFLALQNDAKAVWFIGRAQALKEGSRMPLDTLETALKEKYGPFSGADNGMGKRYVWQYDRKGKLYIGINSGGPCADLYDFRSRVPGVAITTPASFNAKCSKLIVVQTGFAPDDLTASYTVSIADMASMYDQLQAEQQAAKDAEAKKIADEKAKGVKPNL